MGEFRALVDVAERDRALCDTLKRVLKLSKASGCTDFCLRCPAGQALNITCFGYDGTARCNRSVS